MMTLYDFISKTERDYDVYDDVFDAEVTVCYISEDEEDDDNAKFCNEIIKKVNFIKQTDDCILIADWTGMIKRNMDKFKAFTKKHWYECCQYEDDEDEFVYQWINEIHSYMSGYAPEDLYKELADLAHKLI